MGFHCNREKKKKMPYMCFKKNIELNLNSFSTPSGSDPYPQPLRVHCRSSVPSLCLRSSFAPEGGQKATPKRLHSEATSTPKPACQSETDRYALQCNSSDLTTTASGKSKKLSTKSGKDNQPLRATVLQFGFDDNHIRKKTKKMSTKNRRRHCGPFAELGTP